MAEDAFDAGSVRLAVILGEAGDTAALLDHVIRDWTAVHGPPHVVVAPPASEWPFLHPLAQALAKSPTVIRVEDLHDAFVNHQTASTRLVTTQPVYLMNVWFDAVGDRQDVLILATADEDALAVSAPDLLARRGPFSATWMAGSGRKSGRADTPRSVLAAAMRTESPAERLALCVRALDEARTAPALLAAASTCMEVNDLEAAARDLDEAIALAPDWGAAYFERGKLWLRVDDMERASASFQEAATRMPWFAPAWANLGATLGELDRPQGALTAFERALALEPGNAQALNNIGVVTRELGRLSDSERAFQRVIDLLPQLAFGHYNLGHTLFLQGRYQAALSAYAEGQRRDAERNPVQATRLAMCRLATADPEGALSDLRQATTSLPVEYRRQLLADTQTIALALLTHRPDLPGWGNVNTWLSEELAKLK
jgi:tetratricopeptide (TPR) repeat protein